MQWQGFRDQGWKGTGVAAYFADVVHKESTPNCQLFQTASNNDPPSVSDYHDTKSRNFLHHLFSVWLSEYKHIFKKMIMKNDCLFFFSQLGSLLAGAEHFVSC